MLDPSAISALRYRAEYGESIVDALARCNTVQDVEARLLRMLHIMMEPQGRPDLLELAKLASNDQGFLEKAIIAKTMLLQEDPQRNIPKAESGGERFDEYRIVALMAAAHLDMGLLYELPIMHVVGVIGRCFELQDPSRKEYRPLTDKEIHTLYPRRGD